MAKRCPCRADYPAVSDVSRGETLTVPSGSTLTLDPNGGTLSLVPIEGDGTVALDTSEGGTIAFTVDETAESVVLFKTSLEDAPENVIVKGSSGEELEGSLAIDGGALVFTPGAAPEIRHGHCPLLPHQGGVLQGRVIRAGARKSP